ncbi:hypothetical protein ABE66_05800 [Cytobacillus firmus]|nr:hypothetical protein [Cytobacillus firmus]
MLTHLLRAVLIRGSIFNVLREERERETTQAKPGRLPFLPAESKWPQWKSTDRIFKVKSFLKWGF